MMVCENNIKPVRFPEWTLILNNKKVRNEAVVVSNRRIV